MLHGEEFFKELICHALWDNLSFLLGPQDRSYLSPLSHTGLSARHVVQFCSLVRGDQNRGALGGIPSDCRPTIYNAIIHRDAGKPLRII